MTTEALTAAAAPETRRRLSSWTPEECYSLLGAAGGALGLVWLLFERMLPFTGALAFWLCWYIVFTLAFAAASAMQWGARVFFDRVVTVVFHGTAFAVLTAIALVIGYTAYRGWAAIRPAFFNDTMK
jgi:phosphate transport system permease protein